MIDQSTETAKQTSTSTEIRKEDVLDVFVICAMSNFEKENSTQEKSNV